MAHLSQGEVCRLLQLLPPCQPTRDEVEMISNKVYKQLLPGAIFVRCWNVAVGLGMGVGKKKCLSFRVMGNCEVKWVSRF